MTLSDRRDRGLSPSNPSARRRKSEKLHLLGLFEGHPLELKSKLAAYRGRRALETRDLDPRSPKH
ncbi:hypothetical protein [Phenylobacterium sp. RIFCSPHIGHO2_01_FULL_69_31]|uniref:hypothetical protein n=1 Tax=Phenylobacterium sp. RIFCSPHIGHO2_01_FULL_69_31 TaxID=1801944 RepID=UPI0025CC68B8|nr:hypothetical protein [Phenylobacterium sp. RIFCSPHIGHO2_01_FULL_69_31]